MSFKKLFPGKKRKPIIGCIHLLPLPGAPFYDGKLEKVYNRAIYEADILSQYLDGIIIENFGDTPFYPDQVSPATIAAMSMLTKAVTSRVSVPVGVNVLRNDAIAALSIATAAGADFIRVNVHMNAVVADQGIIQGMAHESLRLRKALHSKVQIFADVGVKHAQALAGRGIALEAVDMAERGMVDALIVSGTRTGAATSTEKLAEVKGASRKPVLVGSGTNPDNYQELSQYADAFIVGSYFKKAGKAQNIVEEKRVKDFVERIRK